MFRSFVEKRFGLAEGAFFDTLLRACPNGSRISFDGDEPDEFAQAFREWSHRTGNTPGADWYDISPSFIEKIAAAAAAHTLRLEHHFSITRASGEVICTSLDDFAILWLDPELEQTVLHRVQVGGG